MSEKQGVKAGRGKRKSVSKTTQLGVVLLMSAVAIYLASSLWVVSLLLALVGIFVLVVPFLPPPKPTPREEREAAHSAAMQRAVKSQQARDQAAARHPPVWPPRRPDDWGLLDAEKFRAAQARYNHEVAYGTLGDHRPPPPIAAVTPSWEDWNRDQQQADERQIRWAQNEHGEWAKVTWGNPARIPADGGPLPVYQAVQRKETGEWTWIKIGRNVSLDWQRGPQRMAEIKVTRGGDTFIALRPCGSPAHQDAPAAMQPNDERGSSDWGTPDDLANLGAVPPLRR